MHAKGVQTFLLPNEEGIIKGPFSVKFVKFNCSDQTWPTLANCINFGMDSRVQYHVKLKDMQQLSQEQVSAFVNY
jgi:hypothetical protein